MPNKLPAARICWAGVEQLEIKFTWSLIMDIRRRTPSCNSCNHFAALLFRNTPSRSYILTTELAGHRDVKGISKNVQGLMFTPLYIHIYVDRFISSEWD